jgi:hypothetical protein
MPSPLNSEERYAIAYLKSDRPATSRWAWFIAQCFAAVIFAYGFAVDDRAMIFTGFGTLFLLNIYTFVRQPRWSRTMCSALTKLEDSGSSSDQPPAAK